MADLPAACGVLQGSWSNGVDLFSMEGALGVITVVLKKTRKKLYITVFCLAVLFIILVIHHQRKQHAFSDGNKPPPKTTGTKPTEKVTYMNGGPPVHNLPFLNANKNVCSSTKKFLFLTYIFTAPDHFGRRRRIRTSWGDTKLLSAMGGKRVFMLGTTKNSTLNAMITEEMETHGDIVQENFLDAYRNLTFKLVMSLRWISNYCPNVRFIIKIDDDHLMNPFAVVEFLRGLPEPVERSFFCTIHKSKVVRDKNNKNHVDHIQYKHDYYEQFCGGGYYIGTRDVISDLYSASFHVPFIPNEDAYTGLLINRTGNIVLFTVDVTHYMDEMWRPLTMADASFLSYNFIKQDEYDILWPHIVNRTKAFVKYSRHLLNEL